MSYPRKRGYAPVHELCSHLALALTHPVRIYILHLLSTRKMSHEEICAAVPLCESTVSHHLRMLKERSLVRYEERHPWIYYSLDEAGLVVMRDLLAECICGIWGDE